MNELEAEWRRKEMRFIEQVEELTDELEKARGRTTSEEIESLKQTIHFQQSIIASQQKKEQELIAKIDALNRLPAEMWALLFCSITFISDP